MSKTVTINSKWLKDSTYTITGILQDIPQTSIIELQPNFVRSQTGYLWTTLLASNSI